MHVRHLDYPGDVPAILSFLPELYETNFPDFVADSEFLGRKRAQIRQAARDPGQAILVAADRDGICGFIWLRIEVLYSGRLQGEVSAVHVAHRARGKGVGHLLMQEGEALLRTHGCQNVYLMVTAANQVAVRLYERLDYRITRYQMEKLL